MPVVKNGIGYAVEMTPEEKDLVTLFLVSDKGCKISFRLAGFGIDQLTTALDICKFGALKRAIRVEGIGGYVIVKPSTNQRYVRIRFGMTSQKEREMISLPLIQAVAVGNFLRRL